MRRSPLLAALICFLLGSAAPLHAQSPRVLIGGGLLSAYGSTGAAGTLGFRVPMGGKWIAGGTLLVARTTLDVTDILHRTVLSFGPTAGYEAALIPDALSFALEGTVQYTHLSVENWLGTGEGGPPPDDRVSGGRSGISFGGRARLDVDLSPRIDADLGLGYLHHAIYDNRAGDLVLVTFGFTIALR